MTRYDSSRFNVFVFRNVKKLKFSRKNSLEKRGNRSQFSTQPKKTNVTRRKESVRVGSWQFRGFWD